MATKTIIAKKVTLHIKDEARSIPFILNENTGALLRGKLVVIEVPPDNAVELDAAEADRIIARHDAVETDLPPRYRVRPAREDGTSNLKPDVADEVDADEMGADEMGADDTVARPGRPRR